MLTKQDKAIVSLCLPERLLELAYRFTLVDAGIKKIARYQQFFVVRSTLRRIKANTQASRVPRKGEMRGVSERATGVYESIHEDGERGDNKVDHFSRRPGGIIWHTQGSGKSLTMVMLLRSLALDSEMTNPRIILVTDRDDLDKQLGNTFAACGLSKECATSGRNLVTHLRNKVGIITTLIHKFDKGWAAEKFVDDSSNIFVLVDESHRTNFGPLAARMRQMLPNACYLGFTGTPLLKKEKTILQSSAGLSSPIIRLPKRLRIKRCCRYSMKAAMLKWNRTKRPLICGLSATRLV